ncbi:hypothetical protein ENSA5_22190 [Enhygromyxa salina]|uniref:HD domain-containing protein n=1 Tax=Enhygromyxa salina TaxID=215803 RepID=A0A2S9YBT8_9BACT|nr:HD domain-containing protein [Enhygromyxa salina]PRQ02574.1 hypothetical protein ENSA5_22190 [Enhygromyxa salina]
MAPALETGADALALLVELGVSPRLLRHHELVLEAAVELTDGLARRLGARFDAGEVQIGAALHDVGKLVHPGELSGPGHEHEEAGRALLIDARVPEHLARFCVTHASWDEPTLAIEDLLTALADKLWKGKRVAQLERRVIDHLAHQLELPSWRVFDVADAVFEAVAAGADDRLGRS